MARTGTQTSRGAPAEATAPERRERATEEEALEDAASKAAAIREVDAAINGCFPGRQGLSYV